MLGREYRFRFYLNARHSMTIESTDSGVHPHTWEITVYVQKTEEHFIKFSKFEREMQEFLSGYEGTLLNETAPFDTMIPTMENLGEIFFPQITDIVKASGWKLIRLEISESPARSYIIYCENGSGQDTSGDATFNAEPYPESLKPAGMEAHELESFEGVQPYVSEHGCVEAVLIEGTSQEAAPYAAAAKEPEKHRKVSNTVFMAASAAVIVVLSLLLYLWITGKGGYPWGSDTWGHLFKGELLYESIKSGRFFPLYTPQWYNGIQPFRYWAPLPYYLLAGFNFAAAGDIILSYNLFIVFVFAAGALGWLLWGMCTGRRLLSLFLSVLWFILPDNLRVLFSEGNIPRVVVTTLFPYLLLALWLYLKKRKYASLAAIAFCMFLAVISHAMIAAMVGITISAYAIIYSLSGRDIKPALNVILWAVLGVAAAGVWLYPALKGGIMSLDPDAVNSVMQSLTYPALQSLNPLLRLQNPEVFYFGLPVLVISAAGIFYGSSKSRSSFIITAAIFLGTTKSFLFLLEKLPMNQLLWLMRFTPLAMGTLFMGLIMWRKLKKGVLAVFLLILLSDSFVSFNVLCHDGEFPSTVKNTLDPGINSSSQRLAILDLSEFGSFPSFYLYSSSSGKPVPQVFGWAWQGAGTSRNIVWINTALEKGWYSFMFDRTLELGADVLTIKKDKLKASDLEDLLQQASRAGYSKVYEDNLSITFKYLFDGGFSTQVSYEGLAIGKYADNISYLFPKFQVGESVYLDDYTENELKNYKTVYLSGFSFRNRQKAEAMVKELSVMGVRFIVDLTGAKADMNTSRPSFLGVAGEPVRFTGEFPSLSVFNSEIRLSGIPEEYPSWNTLYLENLDTILGSSELKKQQLDFLGNKYNGNITFIGFNLPFFAVETRDSLAIKLLEEVTGMTAYDVPARRPVKTEVSADQDVITFKSDEPGVLSSTAMLDAFTPKEGSIKEVHNLVYLNDREVKLKIGYPHLWEGAAVSLLSLAAIGALCINAAKRKRKSMPVGASTLERSTPQ